MTEVRDGPNSFESAFRHFRKKVEKFGLLRELKERETFTKPTEKRKQAKNAARKRWLKKLEKDQLPKKRY